MIKLYAVNTCIKITLKLFGSKPVLEGTNDKGLNDASSSHHGLDLDEMAKAYAQKYRQAKKTAKEAGGERIGAIAGINLSVWLYDRMRSRNRRSYQPRP